MSGYQTLNGFSTEVSAPRHTTPWMLAAIAVGSCALGALVGSTVAAPQQAQLYTATSTATRAVQGTAHLPRAPLQGSSEYPTLARQATHNVQLPVVGSAGLRPETASPTSPLSYLAFGAAAICALGAALLVRTRPQPEAIALMAAAGEVEVDYEALYKEMEEAQQEGTEPLKLLVAQSMPVLKGEFFKLIETKAAAAAEPTKAKILKLGDDILAQMKDVVGMAQGKMNEQSMIIQGLVGVCAEEEGKFVLPLSKDRMDRLREVVRKDLSRMSNDVFVNASLALMAKAAEDKQQDLIQILQVILRTYASESLLIMCPFGAPGATPENVGLWNLVLTSEFEQWEALLKKEFDSGKDAAAFLEMLDTGVGAVVFEQSKGAIQQVLAQYVFAIIEKAKNAAGIPTEKPEAPVEAK